MMNKNIITLIFLLKIQNSIVFCLKSNDLCIPKQQECKGFYDEQNNYSIKCTSCVNKLSHECESENKYCTKNKTHCNEYKRFYGYLKISIDLIQIDPSFNDRFKKEKKKLQSFNKMIHACERKIYKFNSNDFCLNGENCIEIRKVIKGFGFNYRSHKVSKQIDCKCPAKKSFKCGKYCTTHSIACDYFTKSNIKHCGNHNITAYGPMIFS